MPPAQRPVELTTLELPSFTLQGNPRSFTVRPGALEEDEEEALYWNSFIELARVCTTPNKSGMPTNPHARTKCSVVVGWSSVLMINILMPEQRPEPWRSLPGVQFRANRPT